MIEIYCRRDRLYGWEKIRYAKAMRVIIEALRGIRKALEEEGAVEVDYRITME